MQKTAAVVSTLALLFCLIPASYAYETMPFRNGGGIEGIVEFTGTTVPTDPVLTLTSETKYCGSSLPAQKYLIKDRKIKNVIVFLAGVKAGKSVPGETVTVTNRNCAFIPHVAIGFKGNKIEMKTDDPVLHTFDVHAYAGGKELFHAGLHEKGSSVTKKISKAGLMELSCYVHPWQHAYVYVFDHPYAAITDEQGRFAIRDIPPGTYAVGAWHEALGTKTISNINIESGKTSTIKLDYSER
jgi:hypothetical protein